MGLLDSKSRIVDAVVTFEGRRQIADGKMKIEYYSFSDAEVSYQSSSYLGGELKVVDDPTKTFYFESPMSLPSDRITFESDDTGMLKFSNHELNINNGNVRKFAPLTSSIYSGTVYFSETLTGSAFASQIDGLLSSSIDNFQFLRLISTKEKMFDDNFELSDNDGIIKISKNSREYKPVPLNQIPELIQDSKVSNQINFKFLPPPDISSNQINTKTFPEPINLDYIKRGKGTSTYDKANFLGTLQSMKNDCLKKIRFNMPMLSSKVVSQIFEFSNDDKIRKLDIVNVGKFIDNKRELSIYFVGKAFNKPNGTTSFLSIFTLIFAKD